MIISFPETNSTTFSYRLIHVPPKHQQKDIINTTQNTTPNSQRRDHRICQIIKLTNKIFKTEAHSYLFLNKIIKLN